MNQTKIIQLLKSLSPWELKSFQQYVASPFFNVNESVTKLLELLIHEYPEFEESEITFETTGSGRLFLVENPLKVEYQTYAGMN